MQTAKQRGAISSGETRNKLTGKYTVNIKARHYDYYGSKGQLMVHLQ